MGSIAKLLADNVSLLRRMRNWSQEFLAERADLSLTSVSYVETQRRWPELETIAKLAGALEVPEERLFAENIARPQPTIPEALAAIAAAHGMEVHPPKRRRGPRKIADE